jgi:hypothetical protein
MWYTTTEWIKTNLLILSELVLLHSWTPIKKAREEECQPAHMRASRASFPPRASLKLILFKALRFALVLLLCDIVLVVIG